MVMLWLLAVGGWLVVELNVAVTDRSCVMVTTHVPVLAHPLPVHPLKTEPDKAEAVSVTVVPLTKEPVQMLPVQVRVTGEPAALAATVPVPEPPLVTVRR